MTSSVQCHCESSPGSYDECSDLWTKLEPPICLNWQLQYYSTTFTIAIYYYSAQKLILSLPSNGG